MRIAATHRFLDHRFSECSILNECGRQYCKRHRLLWRDCETAERAQDGEYADGRPHYVWDLNDCPKCMLEAKFVRLTGARRD